MVKVSHHLLKFLFCKWLSKINGNHTQLRDVNSSATILIMCIKRFAKLNFVSMS